MLGYRWSVWREEGYVDLGIWVMFFIFGYNFSYRKGTSSSVEYKKQKSFKKHTKKYTDSAIYSNFSKAQMPQLSKCLLGNQRNSVDKPFFKFSQIRANIIESRLTANNSQSFENLNNQSFVISGRLDKKSSKNSHETERNKAIRRYKLNKSIRSKANALLKGNKSFDLFKIGTEITNGSLATNPSFNLGLK